MNFAELEKLFYEYGKIPLRIKKLRQELNDLLQENEEVLTTLKASVLERGARSGKLSDPVLQAVIRAGELFGERIEKLRQEIECLNKKRDLIDELLKGLTPTEYRIIELRYFQGAQWVAVALGSNYSRRQCINIKNAVLTRLAI